MVASAPEPRHRRRERAASPASRDDPQRRTMIALLGLIALILIGWALSVTAPVTMPLAFAFFLAVIVHPIQSRLESRLPRRLRWVGVMVSMLVIVAVLAVLGGALWLFAELMTEQLPAYVERLQSTWHGFIEWLRNQGLPLREVQERAGGAVASAGTYVPPVLASLWQIVITLVLIFFFVFLMLLEASLWRRKAMAALSDSRIKAVLETVEAATAKIRRYLVVRTGVSLISGLVAGAWLWLTGVDFAYLWGFLAFALNYVPNIGSIIAVIPPTLLAVVQYGPGWALLVLAGLVASEQVIGNYVDPKLTGRTLDISPLVVLVSVIFWGWLWGPAGAVLAVPPTVLVIVACEHVDSLRPVAKLLAGSPDALQAPDPASARIGEGKWRSSTRPGPSS